MRVTLLTCHPYLKGADLSSDYSFGDLCQFQCLLFVSYFGSTIEVFIGAKRVSHYYFSGQSQTPATIYPFNQRSSKSK